MCKYIYVYLYIFINYKHINRVISYKLFFKRVVFIFEKINLHIICIVFMSVVIVLYHNQVRIASMCLT